MYMYNLGSNIQIVKNRSTLPLLKKKKYYHLDCPPQSSAGQECPSILVLLQDLDCLFSIGPQMISFSRDAL